MSFINNKTKPNSNKTGKSVAQGVGLGLGGAGAAGYIGHEILKNNSHEDHLGVMGSHFANAFSKGILSEDTGFSGGNSVATSSGPAPYVGNKTFPILKDKSQLDKKWSIGMKRNS